MGKSRKSAGAAIALWRPWRRRGYVEAGSLFVAGDLLNQLTATHFGVREFGVPFLGAYGACSTMGLSLMLAAALVDGGFADYVAAEASSHFCTSGKTVSYAAGLWVAKASLRDLDRNGKR